MAHVLAAEWSREKRFKWQLVEITAKQGRRSTRGRWTRPDIAVLSLRRYRYVPGLHLEVWTFELKTTEAADVSSVYEAVAHARFATRSYLAFPWPARPTADQDERLEAIRSEAERHGIGLLLFGDPADFETWQEVVVPVRTRADLARIDEFIAQQISDEAKSELQEQLR